MNECHICECDEREGDYCDMCGEWTCRFCMSDDICDDCTEGMMFIGHSF